VKKFVLTNDMKIPVASRKREEMMELLEKLAEEDLFS